jgi:FkbH-like protein
LQTYVTDYAQYRQEIFDSSSGLYRYHPDVVLFALDARHVVSQTSDGSGQNAAEKTVSELAKLWQRVQNSFGCQVIQQTLLPIFPSVIGNNEHRLPTSSRWRVSEFNHALRCQADLNGVELLALDAKVEQDGLNAWYDDVLWHRAKQEIHPAASPMYGDLVVRMIAAQRGKSSKCLVLDLDNTLWGGIVGEAGPDGIVLGQGSAEGEAYLEFQRWIKDQARRGVIIAVCSKNDEANAMAPFERHPEMVLSRSDIAAFVANWDDKPSNLRAIAEQLNIGIDSLVFVDDTPFERNIVRRELPMVSVPEIPDEPALYARCLSDAGYFEGLSVTQDDLGRTNQYQNNLNREALQTASTDLNSFLSALRMELWVESFGDHTLKRTVQLINKTNQFNLTTRRYTEEQVSALIRANDALNLQFRLSDIYGDNGIISVIMAHIDEQTREKMVIDTWLMSCRVFGRQVENACMNVIADRAKRLGATEIIGEYIQTNRNSIVKEHYARMKFSPTATECDTSAQWRLHLAKYVPFETFITIHEG